MFKEFSKISKEVKALQLQIEDRENRVAELTEKIEDVEGYDLKPDEEAEVTNSLEAARNYETVQKALLVAYMNISGGDEESAVSLLQNAGIFLYLLGGS